MTDRLAKLKIVRAKLDVLQERSDHFRAVRSEGGDLAPLKTEVAKLTDDMLVYLRANFAGDEPLANSIASKGGHALTPEEQALKDGVHGLYGGPGVPPTFEPEVLVDNLDGVIVVLAMRYLLSAIRAPLDTQQSEEFEGFSQTYKVVIIRAR